MKRQLALVCTVATLAADAATFHVAPAAAPDGDGSSAKPFATLAAARDGVRAARQAGKIAAAEAVEIVLAPGDYAQAKGLALEPSDGGASEAAPIIWKAAKAGTARVVGGARVPGAAFKPVTDAAVLARLPEEARGKVLCADISNILPGDLPPMALAFGGTPTAPMLFLNHRFGTLARWPNADYTSFSKCVDHGAKIKMTSGGGSVNKPGAFIYSDPRAKRWNFAEGVWMNGYWTHDWDNHSVKAASYGAENGTNDVIRLAAEIPYGVMGRTWGRKERRFYVFNLLDELDAPGEWYLDRTRKVLYFCPPEGGLKAEDEVFVATFSRSSTSTGRPCRSPARTCGSSAAAWRAAAGRAYRCTATGTRCATARWRRSGARAFRRTAATGRRSGARSPCSRATACTTSACSSARTRRASACTGAASRCART